MFLCEHEASQSRTIFICHISIWYIDLSQIHKLTTTRDFIKISSKSLVYLIKISQLYQKIKTFIAIKHGMVGFKITANQQPMFDRIWYLTSQIKFWTDMLTVSYLKTKNISYAGHFDRHIWLAKVSVSVYRNLTPQFASCHLLIKSLN